MANLLEEFEERESTFSEKMKETVMRLNLILRKALRFAQSMFDSVEVTKKLLFVISDGESTDWDPIPIAQAMMLSSVTIVTCFLTANNISEPRELHCDEVRDWSR